VDIARDVLAMKLNTFVSKYDVEVYGDVKSMACDERGA
jgi:hypothetical protein